MTRRAPGLASSFSPDERGFTLIELLVTIVIISILAALAIFTVLYQQRKAIRGEIEVTLKNMANAQNSWIIDHTSYTTSIEDLVEEGFRYSDQVIPSVNPADTGLTTYCLEVRSVRNANIQGEFHIRDGFPGVVSDDGDADRCSP